MTGAMPSFANGDPEFGRRVPDELGAPTGRYVVVLADDVQGDETATAEALRSVAGVANVARSSDFAAGALDVDQAESADAMVFSELGVAVVSADPDRASSIIATADEDSRVIAVEPEQILHTLTQPQALTAGYLHGFRDAASLLCDQLSETDGAAMLAEPAAAQFVDTPVMTWGLQATGVATAQPAGQGTKVAVLDTGFDGGHPDFAGRNVTAQSFVSGQTVQDGQGHGTHCIGTACGPQRPPTPPGGRRYGVDHGAHILVGKVLSNQGSGTDTNILAGINWAIANGAKVISMSLGADIPAVSQRYETVGRRALDRGALIVAAAGNNADRSSGDVGFVGIPANSPSIMAVGAVDSQLRIAEFSARSNPVSGGQVDIVGPGVLVYSSWPMTKRYHTISGTSMATPHVAGIASLWAQQTGATGAALWSMLTRTARRLPLPSIDVGAGLAQASQ